jgi:hypothetical protein
MTTKYEAWMEDVFPQQTKQTSKYEVWMRANVPQTIQGQTAKCVEFCKAMVEQFPELRIKRGVVWSAMNPDNYLDVAKEYPHMWLLDPTGTIIDPTRMQFALIGWLEYRAFPDEGSTMHRCMYCGKYFTDECRDADGDRLWTYKPFCSAGCEAKYNA